MRKLFRYFVMASVPVLIVMGLANPRDREAADALPTLAVLETATTPSATATETAIPTITPEPRATATPMNDADYIGLHIQGLTEVTLGRVRIADGRENGGERGAIIDFATGTENAVDMAVSVGTVIGAVASALGSREIDLDAITLVYGASAEHVTGLAVVQVADLRAYNAGEMTAEQLMARVQFEAMP